MAGGGDASPTPPLDPPLMRGPFSLAPSSRSPNRKYIVFMLQNEAVSRCFPGCVTEGSIGVFGEVVINKQ